MFPKHSKNYFAYISQDFSNFENLVEYLLTKSETEYEISLKDLKFNLKDSRNINMPKHSKLNVSRKDDRLDLNHVNKKIMPKHDKCVITTKDVRPVTNYCNESLITIHSKSNVSKSDPRSDTNHCNEINIPKNSNTISSHNAIDNGYNVVDDVKSCNIQSAVKEIEYKQNIESKNDLKFVKYNMSSNDYITELQNTYSTTENIQRSTSISNLNSQSHTSSSVYTFKPNCMNTQTYNYPNLFQKNLITQSDPTHYRKLAQEYYKPMISRDIKLANEYFAMRASENIEKAIYYDYKASEIILGQMMKRNKHCNYNNTNNGFVDKKYNNLCEKLLNNDKILEKIDFHKLRVNECIDFLEDYIKCCNPGKLEVITGKSERIKPTVIKYLEENGYRVEIDRVVSLMFIKK